METYRIVRHYWDDNKRRKIIDEGLTLAQAQEHCSLEETHKISKVNNENYSKGQVVWFDGYEKE